MSHTEGYDPVCMHVCMYVSIQTSTPYDPVCQQSVAMQYCYILPCYYFVYRKATRLVLAASVTFIVLMVPRAVTYVISVFYHPDRDLTSINDAHAIAHSLAYCLQYSNHSINFFIYVVANKNFRFTS